MRIKRHDHGLLPAPVLALTWIRSRQRLVAYHALQPALSGLRAAGTELMQTLYVLVVDKAWARLYRTATPPQQLTLVYHQALFGDRGAGDGTDDELARSLCRLLRADRHGGKYDMLIMLASADMRAALRRQYDGDWSDVVCGRIEDLPARYTDEQLAAYLRSLLVLNAREALPMEPPRLRAEAKG
jgi:hypothetical protein